MPTQEEKEAFIIDQLTRGYNLDIIDQQALKNLFESAKEKSPTDTEQAGE